MIFIFVAGTSLLAKLISVALGTSGTFGNKVNLLRMKYFGPRTFFTLFLMFDIDLNIGAFTNSKFYAGDLSGSRLSTLNNIVTNSFVYGYPLLLFFYFIKNRNQVHTVEGRIDKNADDDLKYSFLIEDRKLETLYDRYLMPLTLLRTYVICGWVIGLYAYPRLQVGGAIAILVLVLILEIKCRPRLSKLENRLEATV